jgi:hypothetical protein
MIETLNKQRINIKELTVPDKRIKSEFPLDPRTCLSDTNWMQIEDVLNKKLQREHYISFSESAFVADVAVLAPEMVQSKIDDETWEKLIYGFHKHRTNDYATLDHLTNIFLISPERARKEYEGNNSLKERIAALDNFLTPVASLRNASQLYIVDRTQVRRFALQKDELESINKSLDKDQKNGKWRDVAHLLPYFKLLYSQEAKDYLMINDNKENLFKNTYSMLEERLMLGQIDSAVSLLRDMTIIASDVVYVKINSLKLFMPKEPKQNELVQQFPERRRF